MNVAVIGCGPWGKNVVRNFYELKCLYAISDFDAELVLELAYKFNVIAIPFDAVLQDPHINAVAICVPSIYHASFVEATLNAGKHVLVEKPYTVNFNDARYLCNLVHIRDLILMVGHIYNYQPSFIELKKILAQQKLGATHHIYAEISNDRRRDEGVLWDLAPHQVSGILGIVGEMPHTVSASSTSGTDGVDTVLISMMFENINAHIFISYIHGKTKRKLFVVCDEGLLVFNNSVRRDLELTCHSNTVDLDTRNFPLLEPLKEECSHFVKSIIAHEQPRTNAHEALNVTTVLHMVEMSMKQKNIITMKEIDLQIEKQPVEELSLSNRRTEPI